jgi:uncharacterized protein (TIGR04255 family)
MAEYIPKIQDSLRRKGYPIDVSAEVQEVLIASGQPQVRRRPHWEFRKKDEHWSIIVGEQAVIVQTTAYSVFDDFLVELELAVETVASIVGDLVVERVGFRYIDLIRPLEGEDWRDYVKPGFHGVETEALKPNTTDAFYQLSAETSAGRIIARIAQNRDGMALPPDLADHPPKGVPDSTNGEILTILDLDHFRAERFDYDREYLVELAWTLHDNLDILFRDMTTEHAIKKWS